MASPPRLPADQRRIRRAALSRRALLGVAALAAASGGMLRAAAIARQERAPRAPSGPTAPPGNPLPGGTLVVGSTVEPVSLHPWDPGSAAGADVLEGVVEGLLRYNAAGRLQPALAEGFTISADDLSYTFRLREGVRYHNGEPVAGTDLIAAWQARLDGGWTGPAAAGWDRVAAMDLPDARTLTITTTEPYAPFLSTVAVSPILPASVFEGGLDAFRDRMAREPVGSGPFRVTGWEPGRRILLERWDDYWGGPAHLDRIDYRILPDLDALLAGLASGEIDLAGAAGGVPPAEADRALAIADLDVWEHVTPNWQHLDLKQVGHLRDRAVRQALDFATPRQRIIDEVLDGRATPAFADQMPGSWAYHPGLQPRPFDPERAADLLAEAGFRAGANGVLTRDGQPLRIEVWGVAGDRAAGRMLELIAREWSALGVGTLVQTAEPAALWGPLGYQFSDAMTACLYTWTNGNDPDDLFYWHSSQIPSSPTAAGGNLPAFFHPYAFQRAIDALTATGASTLEVERRRDVYQQVQELLAREVPVIFLYWERAYPVSRADIGGYWPSPYTGLLWNVADWFRAGPAPGTPGAGTPGSAPPATPEEA